MWQTIHTFEINMLLFIQEHLRIGFLSPIMCTYTNLNNHGELWMIVVLLLLCFKKTRKVGIMCVFSLLFASITNDLIIKNLVMRPRPFVEIQELIPIVKLPTSYSFPSGHSASSLAVGWLCLRCAKKRIGIPAFIAALLMAYSRMYVGVHYPTDVLTGCLIGIVMAEIVVAASIPLMPKLVAKFPKLFPETEEPAEDTSSLKQGKWV